jgi:hypothetical protein
MHKSNGTTKSKRSIPPTPEPAASGTIPCGPPESARERLAAILRETDAKIGELWESATPSEKEELCGFIDRVDVPLIEARDAVEPEGWEGLDQ